MTWRRWRRPFSRTPSAIYLETLGNPNSDIPDIDAIAAIAHRHGLPLVDRQHVRHALSDPPDRARRGHRRPLRDEVHRRPRHDVWAASSSMPASSTGRPSGQYPPIADPNPSYHGVIFAEAAGTAAFVTYIRAILLRDTGRDASRPFNAFLLLQGTETLSLRLERHAENTKKVVDLPAPVIRRWSR